MKREINWLKHWGLWILFIYFRQKIGMSQSVIENFLVVVCISAISTERVKK